MKRIEFSNEDKKMIVDMYKSGLSVVKIGEKYDCSRTPIKKVLHECGIELDNVLRKIPKDEYQNVIDLYNSGKTQEEVASIYGCEKHVVYTIMKNLGADTRPNGFTPNDAAEMYAIYQNGKTLEEIADIYNTDRHTVGRVLKRNNYVIDRKTYHFNEHYFDCVNDGDKAYIIGLLWSDGHNDEKRGRITLGLQERDKHILYDINTVMQSDVPLWLSNLHDKNKNWSNSYRLTFRSKHMSEILASYGMLHNKSLLLTFPEWLDKSLYPHFIRGYMDGDGSIYYSQQKNILRANMVGTKEFLDVVQKICDLIGIKTYLHHKNGQNEVTYSLYTTSNIGTLTFLDWVYKDADLKLHRKYAKYQQFKENYNIDNTLAS